MPTHDLHRNPKRSCHEPPRRHRKNHFHPGRQGLAAGQSEEGTTALCLGQITATAEQAQVLGEIFGLSAEEQKWLQAAPNKGALTTAVPTDPLIYRFYELVKVYGTTFKELIHEEFGDGTMRAINFKMDLKRQAGPNGDQVNIVMLGKFLPSKSCRSFAACCQTTPARGGLKTRSLISPVFPQQRRCAQRRCCIGVSPPTPCVPPESPPPPGGSRPRCSSRTARGRRWAR
jgi:cyanate lyase